MIQVSVLPNGIRVVTQDVPHAKTTTLGFWVDTGSIWETSKTAGISHAVEHMLFKGTQKRSSLDIYRDIEMAGGDIDAVTSETMTAYYVQVLPQHTYSVLEVLSDMMQHSQLSTSDWNNEKGVVLEEIVENNDDASQIALDNMFRKAYPEWMYNVLGTEKTVSGLTTQDLRNYIRTHYTTDRIVVSASGIVNHQEFCQQCERLLTDFPQPINARTLPPVCYVGGDIRQKKADEQISMILAFPCCSLINNNQYAVSVLSELLGGGGFSSRLNQEVREKRGLAYSVSTSVFNNRHLGLFVVETSTSRKKASALMRLICDEVAKLAETITPEEFALAKERLRSDVIMDNEDFTEFANINAQYILVYNQVFPIQEHLKQIERVTIDDVKCQARCIFSERPTFSAVGPIDKLITYEEILSRLQYQPKPIATRISEVQSLNCVGQGNNRENYKG